MTGGVEDLSVDRVWLVPGGGALPRPVADARRRWGTRRGILVAIEVGATVGVGEASPLPGLSPDDVETAAHALDEVADRLPGATIGVAPGGDALDAVASVLGYLAVDLPPSARFAVETALLDVLARRRGLPLAMLLGARPGARVEVSALLGDPGAADAANRAGAAIGAGARTLKLKLGGRRVTDDVAAVTALRASIGDRASLIGDANGAWSIAEARSAAAALAPLGVVLLEQPVAPSDLAALGALAVPVWADESLTPPAARAAVLGLPHVAGVVLKPTVLGGLDAARTVAREASRRGQGVVVTHALEGPVALRGCAALALALASVGDPPSDGARGSGETSAPRHSRAGLWPHAGLAAWPAVGGVTHGPELAVDPRPGLGLDPTERAALLAPPRGPA